MNKYLVSASAFWGRPLPLKGKGRDGSEVLFAGWGRSGCSAVLKSALLAGARGLFCDGSCAAGDCALKNSVALQMENECASAESLCAENGAVTDKICKTIGFCAVCRSFLAERGNFSKNSEAAGWCGCPAGENGMGYD